MKKLLSNIRNADNDFKMIEENDKIAVGLSGGKDSIALLYALHRYSMFSPVKFEVIGIHVNVGFPNMSMETTKQFLNENSIPYYEINTNIYDILKAKQEKEKSYQLSCSQCSQFKKAYLCEEAKKLGCNVIAYGHHGEDAIETFLMNAIFGGRVATFKPKMFLENSNLKFIRPMIYTRENEILKVVNKYNLPICPSTCPNDKNTQRKEMRNLYEDIVKKYPFAKENLLKMLYNEKQVILWHKEREE